MEPFYTDYNGDYPDDSASEAAQGEEPSCPVDNEPLSDLVVGVANAIGEICDALGLLPGARWIDGGP